MVPLVLESQQPDHRSVEAGACNVQGPDLLPELPNNTCKGWNLMPSNSKNLDPVFRTLSSSKRSHLNLNGKQKYFNWSFQVWLQKGSKGMV